MKALVIGGSGFIGLNVVDELLAAGHEVKVTRRKQTPTIVLRKRPVELVDASLDDPSKLEAAMRGADVVFLAGAYYPRYSLDLAASLRDGVAGIKNACDAAKAAGIQKLVYTSTIATVGTPPAGRIADERDVPAQMPEGSVYRAVKWAMEREIDRAVADGLAAVTLTPGGCVGPWDLRVGTGSFIVGVVRSMLPWWVDGNINIIDVGDVAKAHVAAIDKPAGSRYCLGGHNVAIGSLLETIASRYGGTVPARKLGADEARAQAEADERAAAPKKQRVPVPKELVDMAVTGQPVSMDRAVRELGLKVTPLETALDRAYDWFVRFKIIPGKETRGASEKS